MFHSMNMRASNELTPNFPRLINGDRMFYQAELPDAFSDWSNYRLPMAVSIN